MGLHRGYIGMMEKKMETTIEGVGFRVQGLGFRVQGLGFRVQGLGLCCGECILGG